MQDIIKLNAENAVLRAVIEVLKAENADLKNRLADAAKSAATSANSAKSTISSAAPSKAETAPAKRKYFNAAEYAAEYRAKNRAMVNKKQRDAYAINSHAMLRAKMIGLLNNGGVMAPNKQSVKKYGLYFDEAAQLWRTNQIA